MNQAGLNCLQQSTAIAAWSEEKFRPLCKHRAFTFSSSRALPFPRFVPCPRAQAGGSKGMCAKDAVWGVGREEGGDVLWMIAEIYTACGFSMSDVMKINIDKLWERYPDGFDPDKSLHRKEGDI